MMAITAQSGLPDGKENECRDWYGLMKVTFNYLAVRIFRIQSAMGLLEFVEMLESHIVEIAAQSKAEFPVAPTKLARG
jgi:hypothetical protein